MRRLLLACLVLLAAASPAPGLSTPQAVEVLSSSEAGIVLRYERGALTMGEAEAGGVSYATVAVEGAYPIGVPGAPDVPGVFVRVAVPDCERVTSRIVTEGSRTESGVRLPPSPSIVPGATGTVSEYRSIEGEQYGVDALWPPTAAVVSRPAMLSRQKTVEIVLHPCQVNPATEELVVHDRITVELSFVGVKRGEAGAESSPRAEAMYSAALLNYEDGRSWRLSASSVPDSRDGDYFTTSDNWAKLYTSSRGLHRVDYDALTAAGVDPSLVDPATVRIFFGGGLALPERLDEPRPGWMRECTIRVEDGGDGSFDQDDAVIFYGLGPDGWSDEFGIEAPQEWHHENPMAGENVYWLTWETPGQASGFANPPARMEADDLQSSPSPTAVVDYQARVHFELNAFPSHGRSDSWFWFSLSLTGVPETRYFHEILDHVVTDSTGYVRARVDGDSRNAEVPDDHHVLFALNGVQAHEAYWDGYAGVVFETGGLPFNEGYNTFRIDVPRDQVGVSDDFEDFILVDWYEYVYWRELWTGGDVFEFGSSGREGVLEYSLEGLESDELDVYKIIDKYTVRTVPGVEVDGTVATFQDDVPDTASYIAVPGGSYAEPRIELDEFGDLRNPDGSDYLMIVYDEFAQEAERLAGYRETPAGGGFDVRVAKVSDVFDEFAWGMSDPTAIRDFLLHTHAASRVAPTHALLVGDASIDTRNYISSLPSYVPAHYARVWSSSSSYYTIWPSDPWFVAFEDGASPMSMALGRLSVRSTSELSVMVEKIVRYETETVQGPWKNRVVLVGDDEYTGADMAADCCEYYHTQQAEQISDDTLPWPLDRRKIYLMEYERTDAGQKPSCRSDLLDTWNEGALVLNYTGHGSEIVMAHESVFLYDDVSLLTNVDRLPLYFAASCRLNKFDQETVDSLGEILAKSASGGSIASIGSTRDSGAGQNSALNRNFLSKMFGDQREAPTAYLDIGTAFATAFNVTYSWSNNTKFMIVGDPAVTLVSPEGGGAFDSEGVLPMRRRDTIDITGQCSGATADLDGAGLVLVTESADTSGYEHVYPGHTTWHVDYDLMGDTIYDGPLPVSDGAIDVSFVVSTLASEGGHGRIRAYCYDGDKDGSMSLEDAAIRDSVAVSDAAGPVIDLEFAGGVTSVLPGAVLSVSLNDEHGINLIDERAADGIVLTVDSGGDSVGITGEFLYDFGSHTSGTIEYELPSLGAGGHSVSVSASDNVGNRTTETLSFDVVSSTEFAIRNVVNHPNPFPGEGGEGTHLMFELPVAADVRIDVFTVGGRLIRTMDGIPGTPGANQVYWDGRDQQNDELANGVYLYRVHAVSLSYRGDKAEAIGRALIMR